MEVTSAALASLDVTLGGRAFVEVHDGGVQDDEVGRVDFTQGNLVGGDGGVFASLKSWCGRDRGNKCQDSVNVGSLHIDS